MRKPYDSVGVVSVNALTEQQVKLEVAARDERETGHREFRSGRLRSML